jgi:hypothetical protein
VRGPSPGTTQGFRRAPREDRRVASTAVVIVRFPLKVGRRLSHRCNATEWVIVTRNRSIDSVALAAKYTRAIYVVVESEADTAARLVQDQ